MPDNGTEVIRDINAVLFEDYYPNFVEDVFSMGSVTNRRMRRSTTRKVESDGMNIKFEFARGDTVRSFNHANLNGWTHSHPFQAFELKVRYNPHEGQPNDFTHFEGQARVAITTLKWGDEGAIVDTARRMYDEMLKDYDFKIAMRRVTPRSGLLALVNGTVYSDADQIRYNTSAGAASNTNGARLLIDAGQISLFRIGMRVDIKAPGGAYRAQNVEIVDRNTGDTINSSTGSLGLRFDTSVDPIYASSGDLSTVADDDEIYHHGTFNAGMYGEEAWFSRPTAGEEFMTGMDRTDTERRQFVIQAIREGLATSSFQRSMFADAARAMNYSVDENQTMACVVDPTMHDKISEIIEQAAVIPLEASRSQQKRWMNFGSTGLWWQHPHLGTTILVSDPMVKPNTIRLMTLESWEALWWGQKDVFVLPGENGTNFRNVPATSASGGATKWFAAYTMVPGIADLCLHPRLNCDILNVTP